ncbi:MAG TPA: carbohydrate-binding family 9-like protein [Tepidisphaeraceae bacterium]|jgi:hypothetical protein
MEMIIQSTSDFEIDGAGNAPTWKGAKWHNLTLVGGESGYTSRCKLLYSRSGIYFLFECDDELLKCTITKDQENIFNEDVVEVFLWPEESQQTYFEYEISPLDVELTILVANAQGTFYGWLPWHYEGERKTRHATAVRGGPRKSMAKIEGWSTEFFIPFALLKGLNNMPPAPGMRWRANMYRIDYDHGGTHWAWCPDTGANFHNIAGFGTIIFA